MKCRCPILLQTVRTESGPTSMAMAMAAWGLRLPVGQLAAECGSSRDGSRPEAMVKAARLHGFVAEELEIRDPNDLLRGPLPMIAFWEFNRFVTVVGRTRRGWVVNDPACGRRILDDRAFSDGFTGLAISLKPGPGFRRAGRVRSTAELLFRFMRCVWADCLYIAFVGLLFVPCRIAALGINKAFLDGYFAEGFREWGVPLIMVSLFALLLLLGLGLLRIRAMADVGMRMNQLNVGAFLRRLFALPAQFFASGLPGEIATRVRHVEKAGVFVMGNFALTVTDMIGFVFFGALLFLYDTLLAFVAVAGALMTLLLMVWIFRLQIDDKRAGSVLDGKADGVMMNALVNFESLKATVNEDDTFRVWQKMFNRSLQLHLSKLPFKALLLNISSAASTVTVAAVIAIGGFRIIDGELTIGGFIVFQLLLAVFFAPLTAFTERLDELQLVDAGLRRVQDLLDYSRRAATVAEAGDNRPTPVRLEGRVEFRDVTFAYSPTSEPVLRHVSFTVEPGRSLAIVGPSGSGKSSIAKLLAGQYEPTSGEILIDGRPRSEWSRWQLRRDFALIDQTLVFFPGSIRENLALFDDTVPLSDIQRAAEDACIHDTIVRRDGGYETRMSGDLCGFSGGERQRLEIARALATDPRILLMDEATSALDTVTEQRVIANLARRGATRIAIAHRLSTVRDADEIIVLSHGAIAERGTHDALMARGGLYADLATEKNA